MQSVRARRRLTDVNPHLVCVLCGGYFIDATSIVECLHSFCRSCLIKYLESNSFCPICDVQIHKAKPFLNIKPDKALQDIVYKLVPGLFHSEMRRRREFYLRHPHLVPATTPEERGVGVERIIYSPDDSISLSLEYSEQESEDAGSSRSSESGLDATEVSGGCRPRYLKCPALVTVAHLKKFLRLKYELAAHHKVEVIYRREPLPDDYSLMDVAYIYTWKRNGPMRFFYRFTDNRPRLERTPPLQTLVEDVEEDDKPLSVLSAAMAAANNKAAPPAGLQTTGDTKTKDVVPNSSVKPPPVPELVPEESLAAADKKPISTRAGVTSKKQAAGKDGNKKGDTLKENKANAQDGRLATNTVPKEAILISNKIGQGTKALASKVNPKEPQAIPNKKGPKILPNKTLPKETLVSVKNVPKETQHLANKTVLKETSILTSKPVTKVTPVVAKLTFSKGTPLVANKLVNKETPVTTKNLVTKETPVLANKLVTKDTQILTNKLVTKEIPLLTKTSAIKETPLLTIQSVTKETPMLVNNMINKETPMQVYKAIPKETPLLANKSIAKETPALDNKSITKESSVSASKSVSKETPALDNKSIPKETAEPTNKSNTREASSLTNRTIQKETQSLANRMIEKESQSLASRMLEKESQSLASRMLEKESNKAAAKETQCLNIKQIPKGNSVTSNKVVPKENQLLAVTKETSAVSNKSPSKDVQTASNKIVAKEPAAVPIVKPEQQLLTSNQQILKKNDEITVKRAPTLNEMLKRKFLQQSENLQAKLVPAKRRRGGPGRPPGSGLNRAEHAARNNAALSGKSGISRQNVNKEANNPRPLPSNATAKIPGKLDKPNVPHLQAPLKTESKLVVSSSDGSKGHIKVDGANKPLDPSAGKLDPLVRLNQMSPVKQEAPASVERSTQSIPGKQELNSRLGQSDTGKQDANNVMNQPGAGESDASSRLHQGADCNIDPCYLVLKRVHVKNESAKEGKAAPTGVDPSNHGSSGKAETYQTQSSSGSYQIQPMKSNASGMVNQSQLPTLENGVRAPTLLGNSGVSIQPVPNKSDVVRTNAGNKPSHGKKPDPVKAGTSVSKGTSESSEKPRHTGLGDVETVGKKPSSVAPASSLPRLIEIHTPAAPKTERKPTKRAASKRDDASHSNPKRDCIGALDLSASPRRAQNNILTIAQTLARRQQQQAATPAPPLSPLSAMSPFPVMNSVPVRSPPPQLRIPVPPAGNPRHPHPSHQQRPSSLSSSSPSPPADGTSSSRSPRMAAPHDMYHQPGHLLPPPSPGQTAGSNAAAAAIMFRQQLELQRLWSAATGAPPNADWFNDPTAVKRLENFMKTLSPNSYYNSGAAASNQRGGK